MFCFRVKNKDGKEGIWIVDAKNGTGSVTFGGPGNTLFLVFFFFHIEIQDMS